MIAPGANEAKSLDVKFFQALSTTGRQWDDIQIQANMALPAIGSQFFKSHLNKRGFDPGKLPDLKSHSRQSADLPATEFVIDLFQQPVYQ